MGFAQLLLSLVQPVLARVLVALGFSVVSFVGMEMLMNQMISTVQGAWGGLPASILQLAGLAGIGQGLGIVFGAVLTRIMIWQLQKSTRILGANP
ncbi:MAG: hypothetical protein C0492_01375 [Verminephrobacter sp.]|nr:hypothetical protein [Verminephrobacter sp.]